MRKLLLIGLSALVFACEPKQDSASSDMVIDTLTIARHIEILASDDFKGRMPFTEGETKTLNYLETQFKQIGLAPGNGDSFYQDVPLVELTPSPSATLEIGGGKAPLSLNLTSEFVAFTELVQEKTELINSELIFAGFGIVAPEYGWNDYEGLDVKGKTVIVLVNDPGFGSGDSTFFKGETMTYYGRWTYKYEEAARQGAAGIFIIHDTAPAGYPWMVVQNGWTGAALFLDEAGDKFKPQVQGWLTRDAAIKIFESSNVDMKNYVERARSKDFQAIPLGVSASVSVTQAIKKDLSKNIVAKIEGTEKPDEVIIYSAHWDHLGVGTPIDGDSIYNGAQDNASGTATLLALAEAFSKKERPKRTLVFLAVTAEEQGLLGSKYYSNNPIYPTKNTVANINMDALKSMGFMNDFTIVGFGQSELEDLVKPILETQNRYLLPDQEPSKGYFFRSDHFHFARVGIPALYGHGAYDMVTGGKEAAIAVEDYYRNNDYHRPSDEYPSDQTKWRFGGMKQDAEVFLKLGWQLAITDQWPQWKPGSEFKSIRDKDRIEDAEFDGD